MKTSNKILLGLITFLGFCCLCFLIYAKSQMIDNTHPDWGKNQIIGSGKLYSATYNNLDFKGVDMSGDYEYVLTQGPQQVVIETDKAFEGLLQPIVEEDILTFMMESDKQLSNSPGFKITISAEQFDEISVGGAAQVITPEPLTVDNIVLKVHGPSRADLDINAKNIQLFAGGNAQFHLQGTTESMDMEVSGPTHINAANMESAEITINAGGSSQTKVHATEKLSIIAAGAAEVFYKGSPRLDQNIAGVAHVNQLQQ